MIDTFLALFNFAILATLSTVHLYWVFGGQWGLNATIPTDSNGRLLFRPGRAGTFIVTMGLFAFALLNLAFVGWIDVASEQKYGVYAVKAVGIILLLRSIGDFRYVGFTKRYKQTLFASNDSKWYSPLCLLLSITHWMMVLF